MIDESDYKTIVGEKFCGNHGIFGIRIQIAGLLPHENFSDMPESFRFALYDAESKIKDELLAYVIANNPEEQERAKQEKQVLLELFPKYSKAIPIENGYCKSGCCRHLPWFKVFTDIGEFTIGRRKHVIHLEWTNTTCELDASSLFPNEDVTKHEKIIHAWSCEKAKEYIQKIFENA